MKQQGFASYITQMKQVGPTSMGQERLQEALQRERSAARVSASEHVVMHRHGVLPSAGVVARRAVLAAAAVAAVVLVAGVVSGNMVGSGRTGGAAAIDGPVLAAYAQGVEQADGSVLLPASFGTSVDWDQGDDRSYSVHLNMDLSLVDAEFRDITYSIVEGDATFRFLQSRGSVSTNGELTEFQDVKTFTLSDSSIEGTYSLDVVIPEDEVDAATDDPLRDLYVINALAAQKIAGTRIEIEATDAEGNTSSHTYEIQPVENIAERYQELQAQAESDEEQQLGEPLFTMREVA
ncbi:hypothetical protein [Enorma massiliensis]|uniref:Uncharacterized protein n=1 Tax=Enorma massiliensis TaxID=1472761 RepID=A0A1Y3TYW5_9ACTN|nr:hypothetical protein [Enorma massiliensis]OUN41631.1 hypothetical protein B5G21_09330 [Enorma massiliensis]